MADTNAVCQLLAIGDFPKNGGYEPAFEESHDNRTIIFCSEGMRVTDDSAKDASFLVAFEDKNFHRSDEALIDEDLQGIFAEFLLGSRVLLHILNGELHALDNYVVRIGLHLGREEVLLLFHEDIKLARLIPSLELGDALLEGFECSGLGPRRRRIRHRREKKRRMRGGEREERDK